MNTNPTAHRILCYGDSLTRGRIPDSYERWPVNARWTGVLQDVLGSNFEVIEEGLRGRNTRHEHPTRVGRNGLAYFYPCLLSHFPLDLIILSLGTNNLHSQHNDSIDDILNTFTEYKNAIEEGAKEFHTTLPKVLLVSPPYIDSSLQDSPDKFTPQSEEISKQMADSYKAYAEKQGWHFFDAAAVVGHGVIDGLHLSKEQNTNLGKQLGEYIRGAFQKK